jgi:hypothetical protein
MSVVAYFLACLGALAVALTLVLGAWLCAVCFTARRRSAADPGRRQDAHRRP